MFKKIYKGFSAVTHALEIFDRYFSMTLLAVLIAIVFFQVASRVFTGVSFVQIEELSIMLAAWVGFFTLAYAARKRIHVRIDVFVEKIPKKINMALSCIIDVLVLVATIYLAKYGFDITMRKMAVPMMVLPFPSGVQYLAFPCGMILTAIFVFDQLISDIMKLVLPGTQTELEMEA